MSENRLARELELRDTVKRKTAWTPPAVLPEPTPQPGWAFKYIRTALWGTPDPTTSSARFREGWEPCKSEDHPELMMQADPTSRFQGNIEIGGLLLCRAPEEMVQQRRDYYLRMSQAQIDAVDNNFMRSNDNRMPLFSEKRSVSTTGRNNSFGNGK